MSGTNGATWAISPDANARGASVANERGRMTPATHGYGRKAPLKIELQGVVRQQAPKGDAAKYLQGG